MPFLAAVALLGSGAAQATAAEVQTLKPVSVGQRTLSFDVTSVDTTNLVAAKTQLRARRQRIHHLLVHRYRAHPAARHRARIRIRRRLHRRLRVSRVQEAAASGEKLRLKKPSWTRGGQLTVETESDSTPPTDPPPSAAGPPSGTVVQADYMTRACPIDRLWGAVSDAYYYAQSCSTWSDASDPQMDYSSSGGSPIPGQDGQVHPGYRRLRLTDGMQSIYDATCNSGSPCNSSYRAQAISNSDTRTFYPMKPGHRYVWWISVRFQDPTPLTGDSAADDSQIWQIKNQGAACHPDGTNEAGPVEVMTETKNTIRLIERQRDGDLRTDIFPIGPRGVWQVFALDVLYSNDPSKAAYRMWADQDGDATLNLTPVTPTITGRVTAIGPDCIGKPSIGPYQPMSVPAVSRDYGTNEMVEVPVGASWG
jgi:hypothetical protein